LIVGDVNVIVFLLTECPQQEAAAQFWAIDSDWRLAARDAALLRALQLALLLW